VVAGFNDPERRQRFESALDEIVEPGLECVMVGPDYAEAAGFAQTGAEGYVANWLEWLSAFEHYAFETEEIIDAGARVLALTHVVARTKTGGIEITSPAAAVYFIRNGKIARIELHLDRDVARASAGLLGGTARAQDEK